MSHSYEEIRSAALDILARRETTVYPPDQFHNLEIGIAEVFSRRERALGQEVSRHTQYSLGEADATRFLEVFWDLFRQGIITLGQNAGNPAFPFFRVSSLGRTIMDGQNPYFFHDVTTYTRLIQSQIPEIDPTTLVYLQEAVQAFQAGCILSASVMLGVATEHTFLLLLEAAVQSPVHGARFGPVDSERTILRKVNKFKSILDQNRAALPPEVKEDLDTHFAGILSVIRNFRNDAGHPTGRIIEREQAFVLLQLFIPYGRKLYQLKDYVRG